MKTGVRLSILICLTQTLSAGAPSLPAQYRDLYGSICSQISTFETQRTSANSETVSGTTLRDVTPPTVPADVSARALSQTQVNVTWSASTDDTRISNYTVYRVKAATSLAQIEASTSTSYLDTKAVANTTYYYAVQAWDINGNNSAQSPPVSVRTLL